MTTDISPNNIIYLKNDSLSYGIVHFLIQKTKHGDSFAWGMTYRDKIRITDTFIRGLLVLHKNRNLITIVSYHLPPIPLTITQEELITYLCHVPTRIWVGVDETRAKTYIKDSLYRNKMDKPNRYLIPFGLDSHHQQKGYVLNILSNNINEIKKMMNSCCNICKQKVCSLCGYCHNANCNGCIHIDTSDPFMRD